MQNGLRNRHPQRERGLHPGLSLEQLLLAARQRRRLFQLFVAAMLIGCVLKHVLYVPTFSAQSSISVQVPPRNPLADGGGPMDPDSAAAELIKKYMRFVKSNGFFLSVAQNLKFKNNYNQLVLLHPRELSPLRKPFWTWFFSRGASQSKALHGIGMNAPEPVLIPLEGLSGLLEDLTTFDTDGMGSITVAVNSLDPYTSMVVANTITETFVRITSERDQAEVSEVRRFIERQLKDTTDQLKRSELELVNFKKKNSVMAVDSDNKAYAERLAKLDSDLEADRLQLQENEKLIHLHREALHGFEHGVIQDGASSLARSDSAAIASIRRQLDALKRQKDLMAAAGLDESGSPSSQSRQLDEAIGAAGMRLKALLSQTGSGAEADLPLDPASARAKISELQKSNQVLQVQLRELQSSREELTHSLDELPEEQQNLVNLTRTAGLQFELYSTLNKKMQEVEIQKVSSNSKVSVAELSELPGPVPQPSLLLGIVFSALAGLFFGAVVATVLELADGSVKSRADLEELELMVLGEVPNLERSSSRSARRFSGLRSFRPELLPCRQRPESTEATAFRFLRTHLRSCLTPKGLPMRTILVTSPGRREGKSVVAANLAVSFAQLEASRRTVILDCDLRNPALSWYLGYEEGEGLASVLSMKSLLDDVIIRDKLPNLDIIPAGWIQESPTELISDERFAMLLEYLQAEYDYVIIDSPPVLSAVDTCILAGMSDAVVFVVSHRATSRHSVASAYERILEVCQKRVHGVLNNVERIDVADWQLRLELLGWIPGAQRIFEALGLDPHGSHGQGISAANIRPFQVRRRASDRPLPGQEFDPRQAGKARAGARKTG